MARKRLQSTAAAVALALMVTTGAALGPGAVSAPIAGPGRAEAADCDWQRHSKRIVKREIRHGKVRRVVRHKHWWTCVPVAPAPAPSAPPAAASPQPVPTPQPPPEEEALPRRVSVKADDKTPEAFSFGLSRNFVYAGEVTVELNNSGAQDPHNLNLRPEGGEEPPLEIPEAGPGERRLARFQLAAGSYRLWCSLPRHEEWGMSVALEVRAG